MQLIDLYGESVCQGVCQDGFLPDTHDTHLTHTAFIRRPKFALLAAARTRCLASTNSKLHCRRPPCPLSLLFSAFPAKLGPKGSVFASTPAKTVEERPICIQLAGRTQNAQ